MMLTSSGVQLDHHDLVYEESILRDPYSLTHWLNYLEFKAATPTSSTSTSTSSASASAAPSTTNHPPPSPALLQQRWLIYERAVRVLPGSYKLWMKYIKERVVSHSDNLSYGRVLPLTSPEYDEINNLFERCLVHLHKMPLIWVAYLDFLIPQHKLTRIRRTFDRMLCSIAVTQHDKFVWPTYLKWSINCGVAETGVRVYKRYLQVNPLAIEDYTKFLKKTGRLEEAAQELTKMVNDESFISQRGKSKHDLWTELLHLLVRNPSKMSQSQSIQVDAIMRSGIARFAHEVGRLWTSLADYYIRLGQFEKARDIYEESIHAVNTVRDFSLVFDAYAKFEESLLNAKMKEVEEGGGDEEEKSIESDDFMKSKYEDDNLYFDWYASHGLVTAANHPDILDLEIDLSMQRLDHLLNRRPLLLSSVILRQNPHHVAEWSNRVSLFPNQPIKQIEIYSEAVQTIDPFKANNGKLERLWVAFARFYEKHGDIPNARVIFTKASQVNFKHVDALTTIWTEWIEMELRHGNDQKALETIRLALVVPKGLNRQNLGWMTKEREQVQEKALTCQQRLYKSTKLWSLYADLEENFGTLESTKAVYDQMFFLKIITPTLVLSYAALMWENKFFEDTFRIYEKGIALFSYPHVYPIWMCYLHQFMERYGSGTGAQRKIERIRDLFEQALKGLPPGAVETKKLYLLYAKYEEDHGLARRAMEIYNRACEAAPPGDRYELYIIYLARCAHRFGIARTREIYEASIKNLPDGHVKAMALKYARLERTLGEIDRARGIYSYASQFCDPRVEVGFWGVWSEFEVTHGNQDTFKDMLRIKRSVLAHFAANSIVAVSTSAKLTPENSLLQPARAPGAKERDQKVKDRAAERATPAATTAPSATVTNTDHDRLAGSKRRREEEEEQPEEAKSHMGARQRFEAAKEREQSNPQPTVRIEAAATPTTAATTASASGENPDEINIDDLDEDEDDDIGIAVKSVPDAVFGLGATNKPKTK